MVLYILIGRRRRHDVNAAVRNKTAFKCFMCQYLHVARMPDFSPKFLVEINVNISNELNFSAVHRSINYIRSRAK